MIFLLLTQTAQPIEGAFGSDENKSTTFVLNFSSFTVCKIKNKKKSCML